MSSIPTVVSTTTSGHSTSFVHYLSPPDGLTSMICTLEVSELLEYLLKSYGSLPTSVLVYTGYTQVYTGCTQVYAGHTGIHRMHNTVTGIHSGPTTMYVYRYPSEMHPKIEVPHSQYYNNSPWTNIMSMDKNY